MNGWSEPREALARAFKTAALHAEYGRTDDPFGPDPAQYQSLANPDVPYAPAVMPPVDSTPLPDMPTDAAGRR